MLSFCSQYNRRAGSSSIAIRFFVVVKDSHEDYSLIHHAILRHKMWKSFNLLISDLQSAIVCQNNITDLVLLVQLLWLCKFE